MKNKELNVLSLFSGMECGRIALTELKISINKYYASEIDKHAIKQTQLNFPDIIQLGDITKWKEWDIEWSCIDLILAGTPCFIAGTKVITNLGYKSIEDIQVGDLVLTHKNRFKRVLKIGSKIEETISLSAQGILKTETTANHPYYVREMKRSWNNPLRTSHRVFSDPKWKEVKDLAKGDFIGVPINNQSINELNITSEEAYILGRYIADGHTRKDFRTTEGRPNDRLWQLILRIGEHKIDSFHTDAHYSCYPHSESVYRVVFSSKRLVSIAEEHCGCGAINKFISPTLLNLPRNILKRLLEGYMEGDGCHTNNTHKATTISKKLAMSLSLAIGKVYRKHSNIEFTKRPTTTCIQNRIVNQNDSYTVYFNKEERKQDSAEVIDDIIWLPFKKKEITGGMKVVYNMEVADDNSYTANNAIVHNCQGFSFAGKQLAFDDPRSKLFFVFIDIMNYIKSLNPDVMFLLENVNMKKDYMNVISEYCGVLPVNINSNLVSAQNRNRWYWTNIRTKEVGLFGDIIVDITHPKDKGILLRDILEREVDEKYYIKNENTLKFITDEWRIKKKYTQIDGEGKSLPLMARVYASWCGDYIYQRPRGNNKGVLFEGKTPTISACSWEQNNLLLSDRIRRLTPTECARLQTVPSWYRWECSDTQAYRMLGNGWTIDVISHILSFIKKTDNKNEK